MSRFATAKELQSAMPDMEQFPIMTKQKKTEITEPLEVEEILGEEPAPIEQATESPVGAKLTSLHSALNDTFTDLLIEDLDDSYLLLQGDLRAIVSKTSTIDAAVYGLHGLGFVFK